jgi:hypothetical protein
MKDTVEHHPSLSVFSLRRKGYFENMDSEGGYTLTTGGQTIPLTSTPCYFGGVRCWFLCPSCGKRVGILYRIGVYLCRDCHGLTYRERQLHGSQVEFLWRGWKMKQKLLKIFDGEGQKGFSKVECQQMEKLTKKMEKLCLNANPEKPADFTGSLEATVQIMRGGPVPEVFKRKPAGGDC